MSIRIAVLTLSIAAAAVCGCASKPIVLTTASQQARESADQEQKTADQYRTLGAPEAARQAQKRADDYRAESEKKSGSFFDWFVDVLFYSWLNTQAASAGVKTGR